MNKILESLTLSSFLKKEIERCNVCSFLPLVTCFQDSWTSTQLVYGDQLLTFRVVANFQLPFNMS